MFWKNRLCFLKSMGLGLRRVAYTSSVTIYCFIEGTLFSNFRLMFSSAPWGRRDTRAQHYFRTKFWSCQWMCIVYCLTDVTEFSEGPFTGCGLGVTHCKCFICFVLFPPLSTSVTCASFATLDKSGNRVIRFTFTIPGVLVRKSSTGERKPYSESGELTVWWEPHMRYSLFLMTCRAYGLHIY